MTAKVKRRQKMKKKNLEEEEGEAAKKTTPPSSSSRRRGFSVPGFQNWAIVNVVASASASVSGAKMYTI